MNVSRLAHVVHERGLHMGRRSHAHVRGRPAGISTGFTFIGLVNKRYLDRLAAGARRLGSRHSGGEPRRTLADDDQITE